MTVGLIGIQASDAVAYWPVIKPFVQRALNEGRGELTADDVIRLVTDRSAQLWVIMLGEQPRVVGVMVTELVTYPSGKSVCRVILLSGEVMDEWGGSVTEQLGDWARAKGAISLEAYTRPGMVKKMKANGWSETYRVIEKGL